MTASARTADFTARVPAATNAMSASKRQIHGHQLPLLVGVTGNNRPIAASQFAKVKTLDLPSLQQPIDRQCCFGIGQTYLMNRPHTPHQRKISG
ncbi:hypothetical protein [Rhodoferax sp. PAMC 29310]|uniref:hypothetical protein n=1 Tax=Rhodoferax sp. PAMC 29310 TaxID=2822760 RepID=UPI001B3303A9|nr:hypothetical protein [Rhodoferax sp. PAMC 29310]